MDQFKWKIWVEQINNENIGLKQLNCVRKWSMKSKMWRTCQNYYYQWISLVNTDICQRADNHLSVDNNLKQHIKFAIDI